MDGVVLFPGLLRGAAVAKWTGSDDETHTSGADLGCQSHLHSGISAQGQRSLQMQVNCVVDGAWRRENTLRMMHLTKHPLCAWFVQLLALFVVYLR